jgi:hypothetical protein
VSALRIDEGVPHPELFCQPDTAITSVEDLVSHCGGPDFGLGQNLDSVNVRQHGPGEQPFDQKTPAAISHDGRPSSPGVLL